jgi:hypothetical protein
MNRRRRWSGIVSVALLSMSIHGCDPGYRETPPLDTSLGTVCPGCPSTAFCDAKGTCVECRSRADCTRDTPACEFGTCVACASSADCQGQFCAKGQCLDLYCTTSSDCQGEAGVCDPITRACVQCLSNVDCIGVFGSPWCDVARGACSACLSDADCPAPTPYCDLLRNGCAPCRANKGCATGEACFFGYCMAACHVDTDCGTDVFNKCDTQSGLCVECTSPADCRGNPFTGKCLNGFCIG